MINREEILAYVKTKYNVVPDYPWARTPNTAILRHKNNRKWFGAILDITEDKLGLDGSKLIDVLNLKCVPDMIGSLQEHESIFPAYHMSKKHWITILLDNSISLEKVHQLIDLSFELTK